MARQPGKLILAGNGVDATNFARSTHRIDEGSVLEKVFTDISAIVSIIRKVEGCISRGRYAQISELCNQVEKQRSVIFVFLFTFWPQLVLDWEVKHRSEVRV